MEPEERTTEVLEGGSNITRVVGPEGDWRPPRVGVGVTALDVLRDLVPLESPNSDLGVVPKRGEDTTSSHVEGVTSTSFAVGEGATIVVTARTQALGGDKVSGETLAHCAVHILVLGWDIGVGIADAICTGVEGVLIGRVFVHEFDNINLGRKCEINMLVQK